MFGRFYFRKETIFKYFARIKFSKFHWKDTVPVFVSVFVFVPVAVFFRTRLKCLQV